jgi:hypothetical protein
MSRLRVLVAGLAFAVAIVGVGAAPAAASPRDERQALSALKTAWDDLSAKEQRTVCKAYRIAPRALIRASVDRSMSEPAARELLDRPAWKRVITAYLAWACSGSGTTPR